MRGLKSKLSSLFFFAVFSQSPMAAGAGENALLAPLPAGYPTMVGNTAEVIWTEQYVTPGIKNPVSRIWNPVSGELTKLDLPNEFTFYLAARSGKGLFLLGSEDTNPRQKIVFVSPEGNVMAADLPVGHSSSRLIVLADQSALIVGGDMGGTHNRFTNEVQRVVVAGSHLKVERLADVPASISHGYSVTALGDGRAMILGGSNEDYTGCEFCVSESFILDAGGKTWNTGPRMLEPRTDGRAILLPDGSVLVMGGWTPGHSWNGGGASSSTERWIPSENRFVSDTPLPVGVARPQVMWAAGQQGRQLLLLGGFSQASSANNDIVDYEVATGIWHKVGINNSGIAYSDDVSWHAGSLVMNKRLSVWVLNYLNRQANPYLSLTMPATAGLSDNSGVAPPAGYQAPKGYHSAIPAEFLLAEVNSPGRNSNALWWIAEGADVNTRNEEGWTVLMLATRQWRMKSIQTLLDSGADINAQNKAGSTVLMVALQAQRADVVRALLARNVEINAKNREGKTALLLALESDRFDTIPSLLDRGADVNAAASDGTTPLMLAAQKGHLDTVQALLGKGAKVNARLGSGKTPLMFAAERGQVEVVQELLANAADAAVSMDGGLTAMRIAADNSHPDVVQVLMASGRKIKGDAK